MPTQSNLTKMASMTEAQLQAMKNSSGKVPQLAGQLVFTDEEDVNLSQLRAKLVYDMNSSDPNINWGYTSGIQGGNTAVGGKDFSKYDYLIITGKQGIGGMTSIMDLTILNTSSNTYNSGALGCESGDIDYCKFTVNSAKTEFTCNRFGYMTGNSKSDVVSSSAICMKIVGLYKQPAMVYTGNELFAGNGITINNGTISADKWNLTLLWSGALQGSKSITLASMANYDFLVVTTWLNYDSATYIINMNNYNEGAYYGSGCVYASSTSSAKGSTSSVRNGKTTFTHDSCGTLTTLINNDSRYYVSRIYGGKF